MGNVVVYNYHNHSPSNGGIMKDFDFSNPLKIMAQELTFYFTPTQIAEVSIRGSIASGDVSNKKFDKVIYLLPDIEFNEAISFIQFVKREYPQAVIEYEMTGGKSENS